jgi:hypothetical protein
MTHKGPIPFQFHFEREQGLYRESKERAEATAESSTPEEALQTERQKAALYKLKQDEFIKTMYGMEVPEFRSHFEYHYHGDYTDEEKAIFEMRQENDLMVICGYLDCTLPKELIKMYICPTRKVKQILDPHHSPSRASYRSDTHSIYRVWDKDFKTASFPHEITHAIAHLWGTPYLFTTTIDTATQGALEITTSMVSTSFLQEGLAIATDELAFGYKHAIAGARCWQLEHMQKFLATKSPLPSLLEMQHFTTFADLPNEISIPIAVTWTMFLMERFGLKTYKAYYVAMTESLTTSEMQSVTSRIFATSFHELYESWRSWVLSQTLSI